MILSRGVLGLDQAVFHSCILSLSGGLSRMFVDMRDTQKHDDESGEWPYTLREAESQYKYLRYCTHVVGFIIQACHATFQCPRMQLRILHRSRTNFQFMRYNLHIYTLYIITSFTTIYYCFTSNSPSSAFIIVLSKLLTSSTSVSRLVIK